MFRRLRNRACLSLAAFLTFSGLALAQVPSVPGPYNIDLGALFNTGQRTTAIGTYTSLQQNNLAYSGAECTLTQASPSGSPTTVLAIQEYDTATNSYMTMISTSIAYNATGTSKVEIAPGIAVSSLPSQMAAINLRLPRYWRVSLAVSGASAAITNTVGCQLFK